MSIREDKDRVELSLDVNHLTDKKEIRVFILHTWLEEKQGTIYRYFVETLANGKRIYLERPTQKNKGCMIFYFSITQSFFKKIRSFICSAFTIFSIFIKLIFF